MTKPESRIIELLQDLEGRPDTADGLVREHLEAARFNLFNSMPQEYQFNLESARKALSEIEDSDLRGRVEAFLKDQGTGS